MNSDVVLDLDAVSKRFCPSLQRSLWYGVQDIWRSVRSRSREEQALRPGEFWAVSEVSAQLRQGEGIGLIGPNGAGKTTLLRMINGLILPDRGRIRIRGRVGAMIALGTGFNPLLTGRENVYINGSVLGMSRKEIDRELEEIVDFAEIGSFIDSPVRSYSSGMTVRLGFAVAVHVRPDLLLIDEVLAVGDVAFRMKCFRRLRELREQGAAVVVVTHNMNDLQRVADRCLVLDRGRVHTQAPLQEAVSAYQRLNRAAAGESEPASGTRRLLDCCTVDSTGLGKDQFAMGETVMLKVRMDLGNLPGHYHLIVNLAAPEVDSIMSVSSPVVSLKPGIHDMFLELTAPTLLPGGYHFHVSLFGSDEHDILHRVRFAADFAVTSGAQPGKSSPRGLVGLPHRWHFE